MLKWTVQQRRKSAADIGDDVLLLGLVSPVCMAAAGGCGAAGRLQPPLRQHSSSSPPPHHGGHSRRTTAAAAATAGLDSFSGLRVPPRADEVARPRSASPRFGTAEAGGVSRSVTCSPRSERHWRQVTVGAVDSESASCRYMASRRPSLASDVYDGATLVKEAAASRSALEPSLHQRQSQRTEWRGAASSSRAHLAASASGAAVGCELPSRDAPLPLDASGELIRPKGPELMFVATATSATPKMAKLRRLRPAARNGRTGCASTTATADRGEKKRAATPDSGVGYAMSEGDSPSDEDGADGGNGYARDGQRGGQSEDYIDVDFRIQRSASDTSADRVAAGASLGSAAGAVNRCRSSPRLGDAPRTLRSRRDSDADAYFEHPQIAVYSARRRGSAGALPAPDLRHRNCAEAAVADAQPSDISPEPIPRCQTADASVLRPRTVARRRLSDFGCHEGGSGPVPIASSRTTEATQWPPHRHPGQLTSRDWREVTI